MTLFIQRRASTAPTKALRILIGEVQLTRAVMLERAFNQRGYYRVMPMCSFDELYRVIDYSDEPFDLVMINSRLLEGESDDVFELLCGHPCVRHTVIYDVASTFQRLSDRVFFVTQSVMSTLPDGELVGRVMRAIESGRVR